MKIETTNPSGNKILVKPRKTENTIFGTKLLITETQKERSQVADVIKTGSFCQLDIKPGDLVLFGKYNGVEIVIDGEEYIVMGETEVLAIDTENRVK